MSATIQWKMKGTYTKSCSCDLGCPCDFWGKPTQGFCEGMMAMQIQEGHYGNVPLKGLCFAATYHWPGPLHEGNGTVQPFVDERATPEQRNALLAILSGNAGGPWFEFLASVVSTLHEPLFVPIHFAMDVPKRQARVQIPGHMETVIEPIRNIATGGEHRVQVVMPEGMEYKVAENGVATVNQASGKIRYDHPNSHSSLAAVEHTPAGVA